MEKRAKILLVDDDIDFVESTKMILESKPYEVVVAYEGEEGLRNARHTTCMPALSQTAIPRIITFYLAISCGII